MTIHGIRSVRSEEHGGTTQLLRIEPTSGRSLGTDEAIERMTAAIRLLFTQRCSLWCGDLARADTVTLDVILTIL